MSIQDMIDSGIELYNVVIAEYIEGDFDRNVLYHGNVYDMPRSLRKKEIGYIYYEELPGCGKNCVVFEIKN